MNFAIVRFTDEDDAPGIVSTNWVSETRDTCWFPNVKSEDRKNKLLLARHNPEENWLKCPIRILREFRTYQDARSHLSQAEETSSLESVDETPKIRKRKRKIIVLPGEDESNEENEGMSNLSAPPTPSDTYKMYPAPPVTVTPSVYSIKSTPQSHISHSQRFFCSSSSKSSSSTLTPQRRQHSNDSERSSSCSSMESFNVLRGNDNDIHQLRLNQSMIWKVLDEFTTIAQRLESKIDTLLAKQNNQGSGSHIEVENEEDMNLIASFPVQTEEDFQRVNARIAQSSSFKHKLIRILMTAGGKDVRAVVTNVLRKLMADMLAETYSLTGKPTKNGPIKKSFSKTETFRLITEICVRTYKHAKESDLREAVSDWLMQAKFRRTRRESRKSLEPAEAYEIN